MYHDGVKVDEETSDIQVDTNTDPAALGGIWGKIRDHTGGNIGSGGRYFDGILDEFRVTNSVLSADYIKTSFNTQNDPTNFVREGIHLSETLSLDDSVTKQVDAKLTESISLSDSVSKTTNILLTESVLLTDVTAEEEEEAGGGEGGEEREPEEVIELISFTDSITKEINKHLSESITLTDSYSNQVEILLSESVALTDAITDEKSVTQSLTESVSLTDSVGKDVTTALTESITLTDNT